MSEIKYLLTLILICLVFFFSGKPATAKQIVDKTINFTAKTAYYTTKYALKSGWFLTRKTSKGIYIITKSAFQAGKEVFNSKPQKHAPPANIQTNYPINDDIELPPPPELLD